MGKWKNEPKEGGGEKEKGEEEPGFSIILMISIVSCNHIEVGR